MNVPFSYLGRQFGNDPVFPEWHYTERIFEALRGFVAGGDFTLGKEEEEFEQKFARLVGTKYAIGVNSGTDALILSLRALAIGPGDEVITCAQTFIATAGAISATGARPVFIDANKEFVIDETKIERAITKRTKAIIPVWFTGNAPRMDAILRIARKHGLLVVEDSCCAIDAAYKSRGGWKKAGSFGITGTFSFHPLKNLNVWADGGMITTNSKAIAQKLRLLRNHGLVNRDKVTAFGVNSRLDTLQAVIALQMLPDVKKLTDKRIGNAKQLDAAFAHIPEIDIPARPDNVRHVFHLYMVRAKRRNALLAHCIRHGVEAKIHYPIALPYQACCKKLGYKRGDFPQTESDVASIITFPSHPYLTQKEIAYMIDVVSGFYKS